MSFNINTYLSNVATTRDVNTEKMQALKDGYGYATLLTRNGKQKIKLAYLDDDGKTKEVQRPLNLHNARTVNDMEDVVKTATLEDAINNLLASVVNI